MLCSLLACDSAGNVIATLDYMVARDGAGNATGLIDFEAHELSGGKLRDIWDVAGAASSGTWPEWLGTQAHSFRALRGADGRFATLIHQASGFRRDRTAIIQAVAAAPLLDGVPDLRAILGGPGCPLVLDALGRTAASPQASGTPAQLPVIGLSGG